MNFKVNLILILFYLIFIIKCGNIITINQNEFNKIIPVARYNLPVSSVFYSQEEESIFISSISNTFNSINLYSINSKNGRNYFYDSNRGIFLSTKFYDSNGIDSGDNYGSILIARDYDSSELKYIFLSCDISIINTSLITNSIFFGKLEDEILNKYDNLFPQAGSVLFPQIFELKDSNEKFIYLYVDLSISGNLFIEKFKFISNPDAQIIKIESFISFDDQFKVYQTDSNYMFNLFCFLSNDNKFLQCISINKDKYVFVGIFGIKEENTNFIFSKAITSSQIAKTDIFNYGLNFDNDIGVYGYFINDRCFSFQINRFIPDLNNFSNSRLESVIPEGLTNSDNEIVIEEPSTFYYNSNGYNRMIKINKNKICFIAFYKPDKNLYVSFINIYNNYHKINFKRFLLNIPGTISFLKLFTLRQSIGLVFNLESKKAVNFFVFHYPNTTDQTISNVFQNNNYNFTSYINIEFPILNYKFIGTQILNISEGIALLSTLTNKILNRNDIININEIVKIIYAPSIMNSDPDNSKYFIEFVGMVSEPEYINRNDEYDTIIDFGGTEEEEEYKPRIIKGRIGYFNFTLSKPSETKCYHSCFYCYELGSSIEHNCVSCISNYYFIDGKKSCINHNEDGYYFVENIQKYRKCYPNCKTCLKKEVSVSNYGALNDNIQQNCKTCDNITYFLLEKTTNCYEIPIIGFYLATEENIIKKCYISCNDCAEKISNKVDDYNHYCKTCNSNAPYKIEKKYNFDNEEVSLFNCYNECPLGYISNDSTFNCYLEPMDTFLEKLKNLSRSELLKIILNNLQRFKNKDLIIEGIKIYSQVYSIDDSEYVNNLAYQNSLSQAYLSESCINKLISFYNLSDSSEITMVKIDLNNTSTEYINNAEFFLFNSDDKELDSSLCNDIIMKKPILDTDVLDIEKAKYAKEQGYDIYNSNDAMFNDICTPFTSENGTDVPIQNRIEDYYQNDILCEKSNIYEEIDYEKETVECKYNSLKNKSSELLVEALEQEEKANEYGFSCLQNETLNGYLENMNLKSLKNSFISTLKEVDLDIFKCYKLLLNVKYLYKNIGSWTLITLYAMNIICLIFFCKKKGTIPVKNFIKQYHAEIIEKNNSNEIIHLKSESRRSILIIDRNMNKKLKRNSKFKKNNPPKKYITRNNRESNKENCDVPPALEYFNEFKDNPIPTSYTNKELETKENVQITENFSEMDNSFASHNRHVFSKEKIIPLFKNSIDKINNLEFKDACKQDNRTIIKIYKDYIITSNIILNLIFFPNYLELLTIKGMVFIFGVGLDCILNALFFSDALIENAYKKGSKFNFMSEFPKTVYSIVIACILECIINILSSQKKKIREILEDEEMRKVDKNLYYRTLKKNYDCFIYKIIFFFIYENLFFIFFWYYCSIFCAINVNSSISWFIGVIESLVIRLLLPFILCIIPSIIKFSAIKYKNDILFSINRIIEIFI